MLTIEVPLVRVRRGKCVGFAEYTPEFQPRPEKVSAAARALALGHRIVKAVETGEVRDFSDAARRMGISQPRVSMLVGLTFLAPDIQERVLCPSGIVGRFSFHHLLFPARQLDWCDQRRYSITTRFPSSPVCLQPGPGSGGTRPVRALTRWAWINSVTQANPPLLD